MLLVQAQASQRHGCFMLTYLAQRTSTPHLVRGPHIPSSYRRVSNGTNPNNLPFQSRWDDPLISTPKPGDIVMAQNGLAGAFADLVEGTNPQVSRTLRASLCKKKENLARPAILMSSTRLPDGKLEHRVCLVTGFGGNRPEFPTVSPVHRYWAVALDKTPAYPSDVPSFELRRSVGHHNSFIICLAFVPLGGRVLPYIADPFYRASLAPGELERLRSIVLQKYLEWSVTGTDVMKEEKRWGYLVHRYLYRLNKAATKSTGLPTEIKLNHPGRLQEFNEWGLKKWRGQLLAKGIQLPGRKP